MFRTVSNLMAHFKIISTTQENFGEIKVMVGNTQRYTHVKIKLNIFACRQNCGATDLREIFNHYSGYLNHFLRTTKLYFRLKLLCFMQKVYLFYFFMYDSYVVETTLFVRIRQGKMKMKIDENFKGEIHLCLYKEPNFTQSISLIQNNVN